ncbi:MAG: translational GTPase TypA [Armatimonadetes bacterium]|nr:translational GTPase TypA [Armatimonadota bacterium]
MSRTETQNHLRNIAIIAHVDHGKTTLVDGMLKQGGAFRAHQAVAERVMDKMDLERERGITIVSKHTAITYGDVKINIVDTPGHADFGGEVERVMSLVDGVLLLIDAVEGPMPQTRFVLSKALQAGHKAVVVVNKIDRPNARLDWVVDQTFDLFAALGANDAQLDFPVVYTNALQGTATLDPAHPGRNLVPLFETIIGHLDPPAGDPSGPTQVRVTTLDYDDYKGRIAIGKVNAGSIKTGQSVAVIGRGGEVTSGKVAQVFIYQGLNRVEVDEAQAGEIVAVSGLPDVGIGETIADRLNPVAMPATHVDEPTLRMTFGVNTSPLAGREGTFSTSRKLRERLTKELQTNIALRVEDTDSADQFLVSGRGELHLAVLIETMRREGYELQVSQPEVIFHEEGGRRLEPVEDVEVDVAEEHSGPVIEALSRRRGEMRNMQADGSGHIHLHFQVPTRGLLGFRNQFLTMTRGTGVLNSLFAGYQPYAGDLGVEKNGSLLASESGMTTTFGLMNAEERGVLFVGPGTEVYEGMIVGKNARDTDLEVNVCRQKHLTSMRESTKETFTRLTKATDLSLDDCIEYIGPDELVEVTPKNIRMRKRELNTEQRRKQAKARP